MNEEESNEEENNEKSTQKVILISIAALLLISAGILFYSEFYQNSTKNIAEQMPNNRRIATEQNDDTGKNAQIMSPEYIEKLVAEADFAYENEAIRLSEPRNKSKPYTIDKQAGSNTNSVFTGRRINIAVTGLDGRIGSPSKLADANHVVSILVETGEIEITSIPRDTYCDLGYEITDSTVVNLNKLTYTRSNKGRARYHQELARIARIDKIHYHIEFGFSQAMGIIEFLGYKEPAKTLQVLRSRKGLGGDDFQRCYTQGQFIRQAMLGHFNKFTGTLGKLLARAGLLMVETNLTGDVVADIIDKLEQVGFPQSPESIVVRVRPPIKMDYKVYDFSDEETVRQLVQKIENFNRSRFEKGIENPQSIIDVAQRLNAILQSAVADTAQHPARVISKLSPYFEQRAWYQVRDINERGKIRNEFGILLSNAYTKRNRKEEAIRVLEIIEAEKNVFEHQ